MRKGEERKERMDRGARDLAAARMRGDLPPEVDANDASKLVNPHVPEYMSKAPWYVSQGEGPTLAHQRLQPASGELDQSMTALEPLYRRGQTQAHGATKFRPGACRNCGAMTHAERECVERPRKLGAWKTGTNFAADEVVPGVMTANLKLGWDAKRDRFAGYDAAQAVERTAARFAEAEALRGEHLRAEAARAAEAKLAARKARRAARAAAKAAARGSGGGGPRRRRRRGGGGAAGAAAAAAEAEGGERMTQPQAKRAATLVTSGMMMQAASVAAARMRTRRGACQKRCSRPWRMRLGMAALQRGAPPRQGGQPW